MWSRWVQAVWAHIPAFCAQIAPSPGRRPYLFRYARFQVHEGARVDSRPRRSGQRRVPRCCVDRDARGRIGEEIQRFLDPDSTSDDESSFFARYEATTPMRRPQTPADVAKAVVFLASLDAANITGQCLHVDGGAIIRD